MLDERGFPQPSLCKEGGIALVLDSVDQCLGFILPITKIFRPAVGAYQKWIHPQIY